jgi:hypothetical protein
MLAWFAASLSLAQAPLCTLNGQDFRAEFRARDARLTQVTVGGRPWLQKPLALVLVDELTGERQTVTAPPQGVRIEGRSARWTQSVRDWEIVTRVEAAADLTLGVTLRNRRAERRSISAVLDLSGIPADSQPFLPGAHSRPPLHPARTLRFGYRSDSAPIVFPAGSFLSAATNTGVTMSSAIDQPAQGFDVELSAAQGPFIARRELRAEPEGEVETSFRFSFHAPEARSALRAIRDHYPNAVRAHDSRAVEINGSFLWTPLASPDQARQWRAQGIRWVELIFTAPFIGEFAPSKNPWSPAIDDLWIWEKLTPGAPPPSAGLQPVRAFLERRMPPWMTFDRVRDFIRVLHANDIRVFLYFQPSTAWSVFALERFPSDVARNAEGEVIPDWLEQIAMNPRLGSRWAAHLEAQFRGLLDSYPEADGIFMDQSHFDFFDYAHDDGVTIRGGRPAYRMGIAIRELTARLVEIARSRGKMVWWNGPWMAEMGAAGDGHLSEASESIEALQYFGLGSKPITTGAAAIDSYDRVLLAGAQPAAPILSTIMLSHRYAKEVPASAEPPAGELALYRQYQPLFEAVRRREWFLGPTPIVVPDGFEANAFRDPNGDYVFPIVTSHAEPGAGWFFDVPVEIRVPRPASIISAWTLQPECQAPVRIALRRDADKLRVILPRHRRATVLVLSHRARTVEEAASACPLPPVEIGWLGSRRLYAGERTEATVFLVNRTDSTRSFHLTATSANISVTALPGALRVAPGETKRLPVVVESTQPGRHIIKLASGGQTIDWPLQVARRRSADSAKLLSARIEFEGWIPDGSPDLRSESYADQFHVEGSVEPKPPPIAPREVRVDGKLAGFLPSLNDPKWRNLGPRLGDARIPMQVKLPDAIMLGLDRTVSVTFRPSHARDAFRLRKIALRLRFSDGSTASSEPLGEFATMPPGNSTARPIEVAISLPSHFHRRR